MNWHTIPVLVRKDVALFFRNRFYAFITLLGLVAFAVFYYLMPETVDETIQIGLYAPVPPPALAELLAEEGLILEPFDSEEALQAAVLDGDVGFGVVLPSDFAAQVAAGERGRIHVYLAAGLDPDLEEAYVILLQELAAAVAGDPLDVVATEQVLGPDMAGQQVPPRDRMLPLFAVFVLMMETMGLSNLLGGEIHSGTLRALLVTPMGVADLFAGKGVTGVAMAFSQAALLTVIVGGLSRGPVLILVSLLLGALLVTGIGFLMGAGSTGDMLSGIGWGVLSILVLSIPAIGVLLPGAMSGWVKLIPSYYLVDTVHRVANFGAGWADVWPNLLALLAFGAGFFGLGIVVLRRKLR